MFFKLPRLMRKVVYANLHIALLRRESNGSIIMPFLDLAEAVQ
jgi:hypothetical protein